MGTASSLPQLMPPPVPWRMVSSLRFTLVEQPPWKLPGTFLRASMGRIHVGSTSVSHWSRWDGSGRKNWCSRLCCVSVGVVSGRAALEGAPSGLGLLPLLPCLPSFHHCAPGTCPTHLSPWCHSARRILSLWFGICPRRDSCRQNSLGTHNFLWPPRETSALSLCPPAVHLPPPRGTMWVPVLPDLASMSSGGEWRVD